MAGKESKPLKKGSVKKAVAKHPTKEESLSKIKEGMGKIVSGDNQRYHLR